MISASNPHNDARRRLSAIILAAGYSSRMGQFKPLISIGNQFAIERVVHLFIQAGVQDVSVVMGHRASEIQGFAEAAGARCVMNPYFDRGMFSSVCAGVAALPSETDACFIIPADIPLVRPSTIRRLAKFYEGKDQDVLYPVFDGRRGHPPLVSRSVLAEIAEDGHHFQLSTVLRAHEEGACNLFVPDEAIHMDMDTPEELMELRRLALRRDIPSVRECEALLATYQSESRVIDHSRAVAKVAYSIARRMAARGVSIDSELTQAGALLHDVAKGRPEHAAAGAELLQQFEFDSVAGIVANHTDYPSDDHLLNESAIVYLADKLVSGDRVVGLAQRFCRSLERYQDNPPALAAALNRRATAEAIAKEVERCLGAELQHVIS